MPAIQVPVNGNEQAKASYRNHKWSDAICFEQKITLFTFPTAFQIVYSFTLKGSLMVALNLNFRTQ